MNLFAANGINLRMGVALFRTFSVRGQAAPAPKRSADASDVALVERIAAGDMRAFEALYRSYHPRLDRFLGLMTARRNVVEEALNDTMLVVWRSAAAFNRTSKVSTWIFAIAYRTALKARSRHDEPVEDHDAEILDCPVGTVKTRMHHARRRLRDLLAGHFEGEPW